MADGPAIQYVDTCRPILLAVFPDRKLGDAEWLEFLGKPSLYRAKWGAVILVTDAVGHGHLPNAKQRSLIANEVRRQEGGPATPTFAVMRSSVFRGMAQAIGWLSGSATSAVFTESLEDALGKATAYAKREGLEIEGDPKALLKFRAA